ncbi:MAG: LEA type 2 family protein [Leptospiraceae bacterium]|nr:LEA type 2 family protein [Leptospiraceae bacterium]MCP5500879.1 LEA type 2 family protein [Leptospiraceae bacterium]
MRKFSLLFTVLFVFSHLSCQLLQDKLATYAPDISFSSANIKGIDMSGVDLDFSFLAKNKVPIPINFASVASKIYVDGVKLFDANVPKGIKLPASGSSNFTVSQRIEFKSITKDLLELFKKDSINVKVDGTSKFAMGQFGNADVPFNASHVVPVPKLPEIKFGSLDYKNINKSLTNPSALFELKFSIKNPNAFGLDMNFLKYSFTAENRNLISGQAPSLSLASKAEKSYSIPVKIEGQDIISLVPKLKDFSNLKYQFKSNMNLNAGKIPFDMPYTYP